MNYLIQLFWCIFTNSLSQKVHQEMALLEAQHFMGTLWIFYFCPGKHLISPALKFCRYNDSCNTIWSISWGTLLPICAGTEANSELFLSTVLASRQDYFQARQQAYIHVRFLSFYPKTGSRTPNLELGLYRNGKIEQPC